MKGIFFLLSLTVFFFNAKAQNTLADKIRHESLYRGYTLHLPPHFHSSQSLPLVIVLHGEKGSAGQIMSYTKFNKTADSANFIVVYPEGFEKSWADGRGVTKADSAGIDDVDFISNLIDTIAYKYNVDTDKIFVAGFSNGGFMAQRLACQLFLKVAAVASVASSMSDNILNLCNSNCPVSVMFIHGTADNIVPFKGEKIISHFESKGGRTCVSSDLAVSFWANKNICPTMPETIRIKNINNSDNSSVTKNTYASCLDQTEVTQFIIDNGGHTWPGGLNINKFGNTNRDIDATGEIWSFFKRNYLKICISNPLDKPKKNYNHNLSVYPNPVQKSLFISYSDGSIDRLEILDHDGNIVLSQSGSEISYPVDVSHLNSGLYMIKAHTGDGETIRSMMVKD